MASFVVFKQQINVYIGSCPSQRFKCFCKKYIGPCGAQFLPLPLRTKYRYPHAILFCYKEKKRTDFGFEISDP